VSTEFAEEHNPETLSDLGKSGVKVRIAAGDECEERPFCAVKNGTGQLVLTTTTDATPENFALVLVADARSSRGTESAGRRRAEEGSGCREGVSGGERVDREVAVGGRPVILNRPDDAWPMRGR
jgi:hypothetical protein